MSRKQTRLPGAKPAPRQGKEHTHRRAKDRAKARRLRPTGAFNVFRACPECADGILRNGYTGQFCDSCPWVSEDYSTGADYYARRGVWAD